MARKQWLVPLLVALPLAAIVLALGACLPVGLGDPETSRVEARLAGVWAEIEDDGEEGNIVVLVPFDARAYLLRTVEVERTADGVKVKSEGAYKAWLTPIGGRTFLSARPLYLPEALDPERKRPGILVARLEVAADGTTVDARGLDTGFAALAPLKLLPGHIEYEEPKEGETAPTEAEARALLQRVVEKNLDNEALYEGHVRYRRVTDKKTLKALFEGVLY
jgi:hypothetical protein